MELICNTTNSMFAFVCKEGMKYVALRPVMVTTHTFITFQSHNISLLQCSMSEEFFLVDKIIDPTKKLGKYTINTKNRSLKKENLQTWFINNRFSCLCICCFCNLRLIKMYRLLSNVVTMLDVSGILREVPKESFQKFTVFWHVTSILRLKQNN